MVDGRHRSASGAAFAAHRAPPPIRSARRAPRQRSSRSKASSASQRAPRQSNRTVSLTGELTLRHPQYVGATHRAVQNETDRSPIRIHDGDRDFAAAIGRARRNARECHPTGQPTPSTPSRGGGEHPGGRVRPPFRHRRTFERRGSQDDCRNQEPGARRLLTECTLPTPSPDASDHTHKGEHHAGPSQH